MNGVTSSVIAQVHLSAAIVRRKRTRCTACGQRRVLYVVALQDQLSGAIGGESSPFCAPCWGVR